MADTTQLEATETPMLAEASDKSAQPQVAEQTKHPEVSNNAKAAEQTGKTESADANRKDSKKKVLKVIAYVVVGLVALALLKNFFFTPQEAGIVQVGQRDYVGEVQSTGTVNVDVLAAIGAKIPGRIERMLVNEGDFVHSGQVVATLEDTDIRQVLERSEARLQEARMINVSGQEARARTVELLDYLEVKNRARALPEKLSGGERQRVAIARALANRPAMILADEPTASLDTDRVLSVMRLLRRVSSEQGTAILVVTHDERMIGEVDRVLQLVDGRIVSNEEHPRTESASPKDAPPPKEQDELQQRRQG